MYYIIVNDLEAQFFIYIYIYAAYACISPHYVFSRLVM